MKWIIDLESLPSHLALKLAEIEEAHEGLGEICHALVNVHQPLCPDCLRVFTDARLGGVRCYFVHEDNTTSHSRDIRALAEFSHIALYESDLWCQDNTCRLYMVATVNGAPLGIWGTVQAGETMICAACAIYRMADSAGNRMPL